MKAGKVFLAALILTAFPALGFGARENSSRDDNGHRALLLHDAATLEVRRWLDDGAGGALVSFSVGASSLADQGISGVSDADPWNMMLRDSSGVELGLAASPIGVSLFDAASNLLGVTANPLVVDLGVNNDVTVTSGTITANIGTTGGLGLDATLASILAKILVAPATEAKQDANIVNTTAIELNTDTAQTASEPVVISVGSTATLIFAASATTRTVTMQNMGEATIFLGKSAVTITTGVGLKGGTLDNDAKGDTAVATHGDDIYGIVSAGTENLRIQVVSD